MNDRHLKYSTFSLNFFIKSLILTLVIFSLVFISIKEASAQIKELPPASEIKIVEISDIKPDESFTNCWNVNRKPRFPDGEVAFTNYLKARLPKSVKGNFAFSFIIKRDGSPDEINVFGISDAKIKSILTKLIKDSPKWVPGVNQSAIYYPVMHIYLNF